MAMIQELKEHLAHALPQATTGDLIKRALQEALTRVRDARAPKFAPLKAVVQSGTGASTQISQAETRRQAFALANNQCEYMSPVGQRCTSSHGLERDHRVPKSLGGSNSPENARILCKAHNQFEAVRVLGRETMQTYLPSLHVNN